MLVRRGKRPNIRTRLLPGGIGGVVLRDGLHGPFNRMLGSIFHYRVKGNLRRIGRQADFPRILKARSRVRWAVQPHFANVPLRQDCERIVSIIERVCNRSWPMLVIISPFGKRPNFVTAVVVPDRGIVGRKRWQILPLVALIHEQILVRPKSDLHKSPAEFWHKREPNPLVSNLLSIPPLVIHGSDAAMLLFGPSRRGGEEYECGNHGPQRAQ